MDTKIIRQKYIELLTKHAYTGIASPTLDKFQNELERFVANPDYRLRQNSFTVNAILDVGFNEKLTNDELRWLRDTWLY